MAAQVEHYIIPIMGMASHQTFSKYYNLGHREEEDNDLCAEQHSISKTLNFISSPRRQSGSPSNSLTIFKFRSLYPIKVESSYYYTLCYIIHIKLKKYIKLQNVLF